MNHPSKTNPEKKKKNRSSKSTMYNGFEEDKTCFFLLKEDKQKITDFGFLKEKKKKNSFNWKRWCLIAVNHKRQLLQVLTHSNSRNLISSFFSLNICFDIWMILIIVPRERKTQSAFSRFHS